MAEGMRPVQSLRKILVTNIYDQIRHTAQPKESPKNRKTGSIAHKTSRLEVYKWHMRRRAVTPSQPQTRLRQATPH